MNLNKIIRQAREDDKIITPRLNQYLMQHGDDALRDDEIGKIIYEQMTTQPRDRTRSFSASSSGACQRAQVFGFLGMPTMGAVDPQLQNIFNDGKWRHLRWQAMLLQASILDRIEVPLFWKKMLTRGTMDGVGTVPADHPRKKWRNLEFGFELKGANMFTYAQQTKLDAPMDKHLDQVARYFLLSGLDLFVILYEDKNANNWHEWVIEPDQDRMDAQREELDALVTSVKTETLPPMLPQCQIKTGMFETCDYGGNGNTCVKQKSWPSLKKVK